MSMKHTKGPWKYSLAFIENSPNRFVITNGKWGAPNIALLLDNEADAQLISASPDLLDAVKFLAEFCNLDSHDKTDPAIAKVWAAINKAEGK